MLVPGAQMFAVRLSKWRAVEKRNPSVLPCLLDEYHGCPTVVLVLLFLFCWFLCLVSVWVVLLCMTTATVFVANSMTTAGPKIRKK